MADADSSRNESSSGREVPWEAARVPGTERPRARKDARFWLIFLVINMVYFLALLETSTISTALPTIVNDLHGSDFIWVGSAYNIGATAFMPMTGGAAQVVGRRPILLASLCIFAVGSLICALARNMSMMIAGRAVQGSGGAGLFSVSAIILSDIVSLKERGTYNGVLQVTWCVAAGIGPAIGGALAQSGAWRWLFWLNLPIAGISIVLSALFLHLKSPPGDIRQKLVQMDWIGNLLVMSSSISVMIALTWAGVQYTWSSPQVLAPLFLGIVGFVSFITYEAFWCSHPIIPLAAMSNQTSLSGFAQTFVLPIPFIALVYYLPVYFQACKAFSPLHSGINLLPLAFSVAPISALTGLSVTLTGYYRPQSWLGWSMVIVAMGLFGTIDTTTRTSLVDGFQVIAGLGFGILYSTTFFPVLAPLPLSSIAHALAFFAFLRQFSQIWAITIGGSILQNILQKRLPANFVTEFPGGTSTFYEIIADINTIPEPLLSEVQMAFGSSLKVVWLVLTGISGVGFLFSLFMHQLPLHTSTDKKWSLEAKREHVVPELDVNLDSQVAAPIS